MRSPKHWFLTHTGRQFWPLDCRVDDIDIEDIAHGLSHICRFGGHCRHFYSVAQHSVLVSRAVPLQLRMLGLLHDATESYIGDMVRPLKLQMPEFNAVEEKLWAVIARRFDLPTTDPRDNATLKAADNAALMAERRDLFNPRHVAAHSWSITEKPLPERIHPLNPDAAKRLFLNEYVKLWKFNNANS
jgi:5'-deoxynucleotidase YfbR-like HD superfamily hydrolase